MAQKWTTELRMGFVDDLRKRYSSEIIMPLEHGLKLKDVEAETGVVFGYMPVPGKNLSYWLFKSNEDLDKFLAYLEKSRGQT